MTQGMVCIITRVSDGYVLAFGADFEKGGAAGFSAEDNQRRRARAEASMEFVRRQCSDLIAKAMDHYECDKLIDRLRSKELIRVDFEQIGEEQST